MNMEMLPNHSSNYVASQDFDFHLFLFTAGAMRLPLTPDKKRPIAEMIHYLTDYYASKVFNLNPVPFCNKSDNAYYNFYGERTKVSGKFTIVVAGLL